MTYKWGNAERTSLVEVYGNGRVRVLDRGTEYDSVVADEAIEPLQKPVILQCSRLQGRIALGEAVCANLDAIASDPLTPWAMREAISSAMEWHRTSQTIDELAYLLGYDDAQIDALFIEAMQITV